MSFADKFKQLCYHYQKTSTALIKSDMSGLITSVPSYFNMPRDASVAQQKMMEEQAMSLYNLGAKGLSTDPKDLYSDKNAHSVYK